MATVNLRNVFKVYGETVLAVKDFNLAIKDKEFVVFVGPSGCGKTTTLRMIAGLEDITKGEISIDGTIVNDIPPKDREIAMVFQNYALYPHMSVYQNMAFGLKLRKYSKEEIAKRVQEASSILEIQDLLERKPTALSGGQMQRVALGRAIVRNAKVYLLDEPLSNLDAKLRVEMRAELNRLHTRLQSTMIYVTHDQVEAMTLGDRIVIMNKGEIQQVDSPIRIYDFPVNKFVASFIGTPPMNFLDGKLSDEGGRVFFVLKENEGKVKIPEKFHSLIKENIGKEVYFGIRPELVTDKTLLTGDKKKANEDTELKGKVDVVERLGNEILVFLNFGKQTLIFKEEAHYKAEMLATVEVGMDLDKIHIFDKDTQKNLTFEALI